VAIEDLLIRYNRMNGYRALWIPAQTTLLLPRKMWVEKRLFKATGKTRQDFGTRKIFNRG